MSTSSKVEFEGAFGGKLAARLDLPIDTPKAYAIFAHCFTCSKDLHATRHISAGLAEAGIAVLRFDFTGLGNSDGDFASTNFSSNKDDLIKAADFLREHHQAPSLLIGHSLGGAAVLSVASQIPEVVAIATIGAPAEADHVLENFSADLSILEKEKAIEVQLAGRKFSIQSQFVEDLKSSRVLDDVKKNRTALLILHSPIDQTVGIENATRIFTAAKHPKSFVSLDNADHLLGNRADAKFAADMIGSWAGRYLPKELTNADQTAPENDNMPPQPDARIEETEAGRFQNAVLMGKHRLLADEPESVGGTDLGPSPYDLLAASLGTCTAMTLRMYADFKKIDIGKISVDVDHKKIHASDCVECAAELKSNGGKIDHFNRSISVTGEVDEPTRQKLVEIADKCPVHRTLEGGAHVTTAYK